MSVEKIALTGGLEVLQLSTDLDLDLEGREIIGLNNIQAKLLGGQLNLASLRLVQDRIEDTVVDLTGIDLSRLLAYVDIDGLDGSGTLDISLPLGSDAEGVYVKQGTFGSTIPGHLVYINSNVAGDTPMTTNIGFAGAGELSVPGALRHGGLPLRWKLRNCRASRRQQPEFVRGVPHRLHTKY